MNGVIQRYMHDLRESIQYVETTLGQGGAKNFEEYKYLAGKLHGLRASLDSMEQLLKAADKE